MVSRYTSIPTAFRFTLSTRCASYGRLSGHYLKMRVKHDPCVRFLWPGLLQLSVLWHLGRTDEPVAVGSECRRPSGYWYSTFTPHNTGAPLQLLSGRQRVDFKIATLVHLSLSGISPSYIAYELRLPSCRRFS